MSATRIGDSPQPRRRARPGHRRSSSTSPTSSLPDALHAKLVTLRLRARPDRLDRHERGASALPGVAPRHDRRRPAPADAALRAAVRGPPGPRRRRDEVPRRAGGGRRRRDEGRGRGGRRAWCGSSTRSCRAVFTIAGGPRPGAPLVQDPSLRPKRPARRTPTSCASTASAGATSTPTPADLVVENDYTFPMVTHFAIEPHAFMAAPDGDGIVGLEHDPAPELAPEDPRRSSSACRSRRSASSPRTRAAASAASSTPSTSRSWRSRRSGPAGPCASS